MPHDAVNPPHYRGIGECGSCGAEIEAIQVAENMGFCRGNVAKYLARAGRKGDELEDLQKARWYLDREIARVKKARIPKSPKHPTQL